MWAHSTTSTTVLRQLGKGHLHCPGTAKRCWAAPSLTPPMHTVGCHTSLAPGIRSAAQVITLLRKPRQEPLAGWLTLSHAQTPSRRTARPAGRLQRLAPCNPNLPCSAATGPGCRSLPTQPRRSPAHHYLGQHEQELGMGKTLRRRRHYGTRSPAVVRPSVRTQHDWSPRPKNWVMSDRTGGASLVRACFCCQQGPSLYAFIPAAHLLC